MQTPLCWDEQNDGNEDGKIVLDSTGTLDAWCCGHAPASGRAPAYSWDILHFF